MRRYNILLNTLVAIFATVAFAGNAANKQVPAKDSPKDFKVTASFEKEDSVTYILDEHKSTFTMPRVPKVKLNDWTNIDFDQITLQNNYAYVPLIFKQQRMKSDTITSWSTDSKYALDVDRSWINGAISHANKVKTLRTSTIAQQPGIVFYNANKLPEPPKEFVSVVNPKQRTLSVIESNISKESLDLDAKAKKVKVKNWLHTFNGSLQFSQAYLSENWYQGGNNHLNVLSDMQWTVQLNPNRHPNYLFSNTIRYKVGVNSAPSDTLRGYSINDDLFQINTQVGIKAIKKWYYSMSMQFKTQLLNNYAPNSYTRNASLLSPGELNIGVGITYSNTSKNGARKFDLSISPLSYNMKMCKSEENPSPSRFGIDDDKHFTHAMGSTFESRFNCKFSNSVSWSSRFYVFSNYEYVQGDWENTFNFNLTRNLITQFYTHLRYDRSAAKNLDWKYWQFKEILSFGLTYRFATTN